MTIDVGCGGESIDISTFEKGDNAEKKGEKKGGDKQQQQQLQGTTTRACIKKQLVSVEVLPGTEVLRDKEELVS